MAEELDPAQEGRRIVREYLSRRGWAQGRRRTLNRQLYPGILREEVEAKQQQCDQMEEEAEGFLSAQAERWRHDPSAEAKMVLQTIVDMLGKRTDLGFFAKRIVERLKRELGPI